MLDTKDGPPQNVRGAISKMFDRQESLWEV